MPTTAPPCRATRGAGAAWSPTTRRATITITRTASVDALRIVCTPSSTCHVWSVVGSVMRTNCGVSVAMRLLTLLMRPRCRALGRARGAHPPSHLSPMCMNSTQSSCRTSRSQTLSVSLRRLGGSQNTKGAAVGATRLRVPPNQTDLLERRALGRVALVKAAGSTREMGNSIVKRAHLGAASRLQGTLGPGQAVEAGLVLQLTGGIRST